MFNRFSPPKSIDINSACNPKHLIHEYGASAYLLVRFHQRSTDVFYFCCFSERSLHSLDAINPLSP